MTETAPRDEMVDGAGRLRPHWRGLLDTLAGLGHEVLAERGRALDRVLADEGISSLLPGAEPGAWQAPVALVLIAIAATTALPRPARYDVSAVAAALATIGAPAAFGLPARSVRMKSMTFGSVCQVTPKTALS